MRELIAMIKRRLKIKAIDQRTREIVRTGTDRILAQALQDLGRTEDVEAVRRRYPEHAEDLQPLLEMAQLTTHYYAEVPDPPGGLAEGRARVLKAAGEYRSELRKRALASKVRPAWRRSSGLLSDWNSPLKWVSAVLVVLLALMPVGQQLVWASSNSIPGQIFYPVKLSNEDRHFEYIQNPEVQVMLALALTEERIGELETLVSKDRPIPNVVVDRMDELTQQALVSAAWTSEDLTPNMLDYIVRRMQYQAEALDDLMVQADETQQATLSRAQQICLEKRVVAVAAVADTRAFRTAYRTGRPERMPMPVGGPLGGTVTPVPDEYPAPTVTATPQPDAIPRATEEILVGSEPWLLPEGLIETLSGPVETSSFGMSSFDYIDWDSPPESESEEEVTAGQQADNGEEVAGPAAAQEQPSDDANQLPATPPGQDVRPDTPPGQEVRPDVPPGQEDRPDAPPGQENRPDEPPGQDKDKPSGGGKKK